MAQILDRDLEEPFGVLGDLGIGQTAVGLADVDQLARPNVLDRKRVVGQHAPSLAVAPFHRSDDDVERRERPLELEPGEAAAPWRVRAERILDHQSLVAPLAGLGKDSVEVLGIGRLLEPGQQERMLQAEALQKLAPGGEWLIEQRPAVKPQHIEDHKHHWNFAPELRVDLLAAKPALKLEEAQDAAIAVGEHLTVEQHVVSNPRRAFDQLGEGRGRLLEVAREQLGARPLAVQLTSHAVVLLLGPHCLRPHAGERLLRRLDGAREHEADRLKQGDGARLELPMLAPDCGFADIPGHEMHALHLRDRNPECLRDRSLNQAFAEADAHLAGDDLDEESRCLGVQPLEQGFKWFGFGGATRGPDRFERLLDFIEGHRLRLRAAVEGFSCPVA